MCHPQRNAARCEQLAYAFFICVKVPVLQQEVDDIFAVRRGQVEAKRALAAAQGDDATRVTAPATTAATHTATA